MIKVICLVVSVICFLLAAFSVAIGTLSLLPLGLAFGFASFLPWKE